MKILRIKPLQFAAFLLLPASLAWTQIPGTATQKAPPSQTAPADALKRTTPRGAVLGFLEACQSGNFLRASEYMDLSGLPVRNRKQEGMNLASQLNDILNKNSSFDVRQLSDSTDGNLHDLPGADNELVSTINAGGNEVDIELERVQIQPGARVWLFSSSTVKAIPTLHALIGESAFEKHLPAMLVNRKFMNTSLWQWIALLLLVPALGFLARFVSWLVLVVVSRFVKSMPSNVHASGLSRLIGPIALLLAVAAYGAGMSLVAPSALVRFYISRALMLFAFMAFAWIVMRLLEILSHHLHLVADQRQRAIYSSVLPLALRVAKIIVFILALLATISAWGYNTSTIWATLGIGSLAVALAAQKTLENFFGGVSVIGDRPVLVGDFCKVGDMMGTVEDIGLRSTRIRTLGRTLVTVPNSQFSTMTLENFAPRDKMFFHPTLSIRCDATPAQIRQVLASFDGILREHPEVEVGRVPVRFASIGSYSYDVEIFAYVLTRDGDRYLEVQTELYLKLIDAVEAAGTGLAVPMNELTGQAKIIEGSQQPVSGNGARGT
ncbi:MAG TPA: mechanosensitive ion channel family protein [Bryobacteraceae bacterium]|nr:mechanosensitive ion channel family protein [Bryobacteraceae bacterium]